MSAVAARFPGGCIREAAPAALPTADPAALLDLLTAAQDRHDHRAAALAAFETAQSHAAAAALLDAYADHPGDVDAWHAARIDATLPDAHACDDCDRCGGCTEAEHVPAHRPHCAAMWACMCAYV